MIQTTPSVHAGLPHDQDTLGKISGLLNSAVDLITSNPQRAIDLSRQASSLVTDQLPAGKQSDLLRARALSVHARACLEMEDYHRAVPLYLEVMPLFQSAGDQAGKAGALGGLGACYMLMAAYPEALQQLLRALILYRELEDMSGEAAALKDVGHLYLLLEDLPRAFPHLEQCLDLAGILRDKRLQADARAKLCDAYRLAGQNQLAVQYGLRSVELYQEIGYHGGEVEAFNSLGEAYLAMENYPQAHNFLQLTAEVSESIGRPLEVARAQRKIGALYLRQNQLDSAFSHLYRALEIATESGSQRVVSECHRELAEAYKKSGDAVKALMHFELFFELNQSVFDEESDRRLKTIEIAHQVETARKDSEIHQLRNVQLQQEIEERKKAQAALELLATQDGLTGISNRRHVLELGSRAFEQAQRYRRPLTAIMLDIDHFKEINDTFGHSAGDKILAQTAARMQMVLRKVDILGRYGGDEFIIFLPETSQEGARRLAERLRESVSYQHEFNGGQSVEITVSMGICSTYGAAASLTLDELIRRADQALYSSKQSGRNRVSIYER
jgi:diguanylate cyclase (GGDEF)-like protein